MTLLLMIFLHVLDDFHLQGILADFKQKKWWKEHLENFHFYRFDYVICLIAHAFQWSFVVMIPIMFHLDFEIGNLFLLVFAAMVGIHAVIDHLKCNCFKINLVVDQVLHIIQIVLAWTVLCI